VKKLKEQLDNIAEEHNKIVEEQKEVEYKNFLQSQMGGQLLQDISNKTTLMATKLLSDTGRKATMAIIFSSDICYPVGPVSSNLLHMRYYQQFLGENISEIDPYSPTIIRFRLGGLDSHFNHLLDNLEYVHKFLGVPVYARPLQCLLPNWDTPWMSPITLSSLNPIKKEVDKRGVSDKKVIILDLRDFDANK